MTSSSSMDGDMLPVEKDNRRLKLPVDGRWGPSVANRQYSWAWSSTSACGAAPSEAWGNAQEYRLTRTNSAEGAIQLPRGGRREPHPGSRQGVGGSKQARCTSQLIKRDSL